MAEKQTPTAAHDPLSQLRGQATSCSDPHSVRLAVPRYRPWQGWQRLAAPLPLGSWLLLAARSLISLSPLGEHEHVSASTNNASERTSRLGAGAARARYLSWHRVAAAVKRGLEIHHYGFNARLKSLEPALMPVKNNWQFAFQQERNLPDKAQGQWQRCFLSRWKKPSPFQ